MKCRPDKPQTGAGVDEQTGMPCSGIQDLPAACPIGVRDAAASQPASMEEDIFSSQQLLRLSDSVIISGQ